MAHGGVVRVTSGLDAYGVIETRRGTSRRRNRPTSTADKGQATVDHQRVQPAQAVTPEAKFSDLRAVDHHLDVLRRQRGAGPVANSRAPSRRPAPAPRHRVARRGPRREPGARYRRQRCRFQVTSYRAASIATISAGSTRYPIRAAAGGCRQPNHAPRWPESWRSRHGVSTWSGGKHRMIRNADHGRPACTCAATTCMPRW